MTEDLQLIASAMQSSIEEIRYRAAQRLFERQTSWPTELIKAVLSDSSWRIRKLGIEKLVEVGSRLGKEVLDFLASAIDEQENAGLRNAATETLSRLGKISLQVIYPLVNSSSHDVRKLVADILGEIGEKESSGYLLQLLQDPEENVRAAAAEALGRIGCVEAGPRLMAMLQNDTLLVKMSCLEALDKMGQRVPLSLLQPLFSISPLRPVIYRLLARLPVGEAQAMLFEGVRSSRKSEQLAAVKAIVDQTLLSDVQQRVSTQIEVARLSSEIIDRLRNLLPGASLQEQEALIKFLGWSGRLEVVEDLMNLASVPALRESIKEAIIKLGRGCVPLLEKRLEKEGDEGRILLLEILGHFANPSSLPIMVELALEGSPTVSRAACEQLARLAPPEIVFSFVEQLKHRREDELDAPVMVLIALGGRYHRQVLDAVAPLLEENSSDLRCAAAKIISKLARREEIPLLMKMLADEDPAVREQAVMALGHLGDEQLLEKLRVALADEVPDVRLAAVRALSQRAEKECVNWLMVALKDSEPTVVREAIIALSRVGGQEQAQAILPFVHSPSGMLATAAVKALASLQEPSLEWLEPALGHADAEVRREAVLACEKLDPKLAGPMLEHAISDESWAVRLQAAKSLFSVDRIRAIKVIGERLDSEPDEWVRDNFKKMLFMSSE